VLRTVIECAALSSRSFQFQRFAGCGGGRGLSRPLDCDCLAACRHVTVHGAWQICSSGCQIHNGT